MENISGILGKLTFDWLAKLCQSTTTNVSLKKVEQTCLGGVLWPQMLHKEVIEYRELFLNGKVKSKMLSNNLFRIKLK